MINRGDLLVARTTVELPDGSEVDVRWLFTPGSPTIWYGPSAHPGDPCELRDLICDGDRARDATWLQSQLSADAFGRACELASIDAEREERDPDRDREEWAERVADIGDWRADR